MNVKEISGSGNEYGLSYFWLWAGTSCVVIVLLALLVAFNRLTREMVAKVWDKVTSTPRKIDTSIRMRRMKGMRGRGSQSAEEEGEREDWVACEKEHVA